MNILTCHQKHGVLLVKSKVKPTSPTNLIQKIHINQLLQHRFINKRSMFCAVELLLGRELLLVTANADANVSVDDDVGGRLRFL